MSKVAIALCLIGLASALPHESKSSRYQPAADNIYHLYTRENPQLSQPFLYGTDSLVAISNYYNLRRTVVLIHGWKNNVSSDVNGVLVPALLAAEDFNLIVVEWSAGAGTENYEEAVANAVTAGVGIGNFINWLNTITGTDPGQYHIIGHGLGGHVAGIAARTVSSPIAVITALDPSLNGWTGSDSSRLRSSDARYVEVIHTNAGVNGYVDPIGTVDFYPNGGTNMPGCGNSDDCSHARSYFYFAESLVNGGFNTKLCLSLESALQDNCLSFPLAPPMGGLSPKMLFDQLIFSVTTNAIPPFSQASSFEFSAKDDSETPTYYDQKIYNIFGALERFRMMMIQR